MSDTVAAGALTDIDVALLVGLVREDETGAGMSCPAIASAARRAGRQVEGSIAMIDERLRRMHHLGVLRRYRRRGTGNTRQYQLTALGVETLAKLI